MQSINHQSFFIKGFSFFSREGALCMITGAAHASYFTPDLFTVGGVLFLHHSVNMAVSTVTDVETAGGHSASFQTSFNTVPRPLSKAQIAHRRAPTLLQTFISLMKTGQFLPPLPSER